MFRTRGRSKYELKYEINIVPLLDVMLVLLLIFMTTTPIITQNVEVNLPNAIDSKTIVNNNPSVIVEISGILQYRLIVDHNHMEQMSSEQILVEARRKLEENPRTVFLVGGAKDLPYDEIIKMLNLLRQAGVTSVGLMTQPI